MGVGRFIDTGRGDSLERLRLFLSSVPGLWQLFAKDWLALRRRFAQHRYDPFPQRATYSRSHARTGCGD